MKTRMVLSSLRQNRLLGVGLVLILVVTGCRQRFDSSRQADSPTIDNEIGPQGGIVAEVGPRAHAEIVCDDDANLDIYFLDEEIKEPVTVDAAIIEGFGVVSDQSPFATRLTLVRVPDAGVNHFQMPIPSEWPGKRAAVVFPKVLIAGQRWHFDFEVDVPLSAASSESPSRTTGDDGLPTDSRPAAME